MDYRKPELQLDPSHANYKKLEQLGEAYRSAKKQLKIQSEEKKALSKQVALAKKNQEDASDLIANIQGIGEKLKTIKQQLKTTEQAIDDALTNNKTSSDRIITAPQFSEVTNNPALSANDISISICDDEETWQQYIHQHPNATIYHSLATRNVISKAFNHQHLMLIASHKGVACGVLPLYRLQSKLFGDLWCSVPFFNYGGVIADSPEIAKALVNYAAKHSQQHGGEHIEYRHSHNALSDYPSRNEKVSMLLQLPETSEQLWQAIGSKLRAQIKKADSHQLTTKTGREELIDDFYRVFAHNMRDLGTPVYSKKLFQHMINEHPSAAITLLYHNGKPVSAGFTLGWRNTLEIPWASTLRSANSLNANMRLYWEILQYAIEQKYQIFDFGRSSKDASTFKFKKQWGAEPQQLHWHYWLPNNSPLPSINNNNPKYQLAIKMWQRLPLWATKLLGPHIVKYIP